MYSNYGSQQPVGQQYGGAAFNNMGQQQQSQQQPQQPSPFAPQPTGYGQLQQHQGQQPMQSQLTGYPMQAQPTGMAHQLQPLQQQYTSYAGPMQSGGFNSATPPVPSIPNQFQSQFQQQQQPPQPQLSQPQPQPQMQQSFHPPQQASGPAQPLSTPVKPQPTGFSQMAASFQTTSGAASRAQDNRPAKTNKIPNIRLSFITAKDQAQFETLFKSAIGESSSTMSGERARDLLLRSKLDGDSLSHIWTLSDTTRAGELYFPEFALAMYLCNLRLSGKTLPPALPENIRNEVSSMVDIIGFSVAEEANGSAQPATNKPGLQSSQQSSSQQSYPQPSNSQLLQAQMTGFPTQQTGFGGQPSLMQTQATGYPDMQNLQATGYAGPRPPMPPMPTGYNQASMPMSLNAQPTGVPGQWGLVNAPASGLPNIDALQAQMMPQQGREGGTFTTQGLQGNAVIPWAITKEEKTRYDSLFRAWDGLSKGYILGSQAIEIFGQSGLEKPDLERIWTLADHGNKGRLDLDEFAVAMHLIYRKLNGYPVPNTLPPELVPPSTRNLNRSIGTLKNMLHQESNFRRDSGAALLPQKTGVSYMKNRSFRGSNFNNAGRKDATVFRNDDESFGYKSSARRRVGNSIERSESPSSVGSNDDLTLDQLRKKIKEKEVLLDAMDFQDEKNMEEDDVLDRRDRRESEELYRRIRRIQSDIDAHPDASLAGGDSDAERRALKRQLQNLLDKVPELASQVRKTEKAIMDARLELFRLKDAKANPGSASTIVGTGPGGVVTESDRLKARAKAMMQQRTAALTGKKIDMPLDDDSAPKRLEEETIKAKGEKESNERMVRDVEESVSEFARGIEDSLKEGARDKSSEHERRRWEDALGVEDEVRDFIFDLQRESRASRLRSQDTRTARQAPAEEARRERTVPAPVESSAAPSARTSTPTTAGGSYAAYKTPEERAAFIRQQAEQRMAERLAALGIKTSSKPGETTAQRAEREKAERAAKLKQAEEEDARRETERQARLAEEQGVPPPVAETPKPALPPPRKAAPKPDTTGSEAAERKLAEEHQQQQKEASEMQEAVKEEEDEYAKEQQATEARLKALEEQVRQGKLRKEEEKKKKKAALAEAKEKEAKLAARRAEAEAAKQRELELQRQLEAMEDESSSDDGGGDGQEQVTEMPLKTAERSVEDEGPEAGAAASSRQPAAPPQLPPPTIATLPHVETESKNPYKKMMSQPTEAVTTPTATSPVAVAATPAAAPAAASAPVAPKAATPPALDVSTNPFHRMTTAKQGGVSGGASLPASSTVVAGGPPTMSRKRADSEDWGSDRDDDSEEDSDDERPGGGSAAQLASMLFGTMAPPRPLSAAAGRDSKTNSPAPVKDAPVAPPPPPPPPPVPGSSDAPVDDSPSSPPPPPPTGDAPPPPPPPPPPPCWYGASSPSAAAAAASCRWCASPSPSSAASCG